MRRLSLPLALLLVLLVGAPARTDERRLTIDQVFRTSYVQGMPRWSWRPGHVELVRRHGRRDPDTRRTHSILTAMNPETGAQQDLLDLTALNAMIPGKGTRMRRIGRGSAPRFKWSKDGTSLCAVVKGDLVWVDLKTGAKRRLTETKTPLVDLNIAPDGSHVSFSRGNDLWVVSTKEGKPRQLTTGGTETLLNATLDWVYPEELGFTTAAWWSPDSKYIAYLQMDQADVPRYRVPGLLPMRSDGREMFYPKAGDPNPKVRIGIVPAAGGETVWANLGNPAPEYIVRASWYTDLGKPGLMVATLDRLQKILRVRGVSPETGDGRVLFVERDEAWISLPPPPRVGRGDRAEQLWRRQQACTGWHCAPFQAPEADPWSFQPITPDGVDATELLYFDWSTRRAIYSGVIHGEVTRGVFETAPGSEGIKRPSWASDATKWTTADVDPTGAFALVTTQDAVTPRRTVLVRVKDGEVLREIGNAYSPKLDAVDLAVPEYGRIPVEGMEGQINWRLWKPADFDPTKSYGLIVNVYAGPGSNIVRNSWGRGPLFHTLLCQRGFLVLQADGRGTGGQGRDWMKAVHRQLGILELEDQVRAVREITKRSYVDAKRVGIWGWSYGGTMACNALTMRSDVFRAGVAVAPVTDWRLYDTIYTERYMERPKDNPGGYTATASSSHAAKMTGHLLLMHGMGDDNVHAQNTMRLVEAFIKAKKTNYDMHLYPRRGHGIGGASVDVFTRMVAYFEKHLR